MVPKNYLLMYLKEECIKLIRIVEKESNNNKRQNKKNNEQIDGNINLGAANYQIIQKKKNQ